VELNFKVSEQGEFKVKKIVDSRIVKKCTGYVLTARPAAGTIAKMQRRPSRD
jgi:hypothetical protein